MFRLKAHRNNPIGFEAVVGNALFFFGTRHCQRALLPELYPQLEFSFLRQVHGNRIVSATPTQILEADGQISGERNLALVIQTADCLPILMSGSDRVLALHAGWRGLTGGIIPAAAAHGPFAFASIGPHIRAMSYEVGQDVADQLSAAGAANALIAHVDPQKKWADLSKIAEFQLHQNHRGLRLEILPDDTFQSPLFHSFRRGRENSERQYSFVALLENDIKNH